MFKRSIQESNSSEGLLSNASKPNPTKRLKDTERQKSEVNQNVLGEKEISENKGENTHNEKGLDHEHLNETSEAQERLKIIDIAGRSDGSSNDHVEDSVDSDGSDSDEESNCFEYDSDKEIFLSGKHQLRCIERRRAEREEKGDQDEEEESIEEDDSVCDYEAELNARIAIINGARAANYHIREVKGTHRTSCDGCATIPGYGYYAVDHSDGVFDAPKLCDDCVLNWSELLRDVSDDKEKYRRIAKMEKELEAKHFFIQPFLHQGLYMNGPDQPFRIARGGELKTYQEHMDLLGERVSVVKKYIGQEDNRAACRG